MKIYRASFPKPMWKEELTEQPKTKAVAAETAEAVEVVAATREYSGEGGVRHYGPEGGWVQAAGL
jgi:hypothetical protein